ncbi:secretoglobin family 3A member 2 [Macrotis lagotis]|uniref:secretoglobin family 3A member 2 n=1 Tax=Macrotis lagotis TaxID=92651 RepID=UPI003D69F325
MKPGHVFLFVTFAICSYSATAFFINSGSLPFKNMLSLDSIIPIIDPLKMVLKTLGISVENLVEGLKKCVDELGPDASEAVKKLLEALSYLV